MNKLLLEQIVKHIFANLAVIPSPFINLSKTKSLMSKDFILNTTLSFEDNGDIIRNKVWGCQVSTGEQELKILLGDCSQDNIPEYCLIVQMKDSPAYGVYLVCDENCEPLIGCTLDGNSWIECQTYLQATFLAGMEQMKDMALSWNKCSSYKDQFDLMVSFIDFHANMYQEEHAGQED